MLMLAWVVSLGLGVLPLWLSFRFYRLLVASPGSPPNLHQKVLLISPCKGLDHNLKNNLLALLQQDHPNYEVAFVTATPEDPACPVIEEVIAATGKGRLLYAGISPRRGQKVNNLLAAVATFGKEAEIFAFVDSDVRPPPAWLSQLVGPLSFSAKGGATTGYRWFVSPGNWLETLRAAWNSISGVYEASPTLSATWGGAMAISRKDFEELSVASAWDRAVSDDMSLSLLLRQHKRPIVFVPRCLVPASDPIQAGPFLEWSLRQVIILRAAAPRLFAISLAGLCLDLVLEAASLFYLLGGEGWAYGFGLVILLSEVLSGIWLRSATSSLGDWATLPWYFPLLVPLAYLLLAYEHLVALFRKTITWRGVTYRLEGAFSSTIVRS